MRNLGSLGGKLCCLCIVLVPLARPADAKPVYTILPPNTRIFGINDSGAVTGDDMEGGLLRTPDGTITVFHVPGDAGGTHGQCINTDNAIAGSYVDGNNNEHAFVRSSDGTIASFDGRGPAKYTFPLTITASGAVVGWFADSTGRDHGFLRAPDGTMTVIDPPHSINTPVAIANDGGVIAGNYVDPNHMGHAFVRDPGGKFTAFDAPDESLIPVVAGINNNEDIGGYLIDVNGGPLHGFIRSADGTFTTFDARGSGTMALALNSKGETTGDYSANGKSVGFIRKPNGKITSFRVPNSNGDTVPTGVNSAGVVAGLAYVKRAKHTSEIVGFIRTP